MKQRIMGWLVIIFLIWNFYIFFTTGSIFALFFGVLMLWMNWEWLVNQYHLLVNKYRRPWRP